MMSHFRTLQVPETEEKWLERKEAHLTYFTLTSYGFLISIDTAVSSKTPCFVLIARVSDV